MSHFLLRIGAHPGMWGGIAALLAGAVWLAYLRKIKGRKTKPSMKRRVKNVSIWEQLGLPRGGEKGVAENSPIGEEVAEVGCVPNNAEPEMANEAAHWEMTAAVPWPEAPAISESISEEWADFVSARLDELNPKDNPNETKWALGVVDFLDELAEADGNASPAEKTAAALLRCQLVDLLAAKDFSPVDSEEWNPNFQRAVSVVRNPDAEGTKIVGKGATGLSQNGKIIRKQEVKIEMKGT